MSFADVPAVNQNKGEVTMAESVMEKVRLGRTDLMVTPLCFGASGLGDMPDTYGYGVDADRARATMHAIFGGPVNFIDTSRIYGFSRRVREWRRRSAPRSGQIHRCARNR